MAQSLEQKILEELSKTGYPTEIVAVTLMQSQGWHVLHNPCYLDDSEGQSREFDIRAYRSLTESFTGFRYSVGMYLMTECKKSEKPWIFFTTVADQNQPRLGRFIITSVGKRQVFTDNSNPESIISDKELRAFHHYFTPERLARTFFQPFKGNARDAYSSAIYSAIMSTVKATLAHSRCRPADNWVGIYYPVVLFSGDLFEARVKSSDETDLLPTQFLQLSFTYITPQRTSFTVPTSPEREEFIIDIVHESYLGKYLKIAEAELKYIAGKIFDASSRQQ